MNLGVPIRSLLLKQASIAGLFLLVAWAAVVAKIVTTTTPNKIAIVANFISYFLLDLRPINENKLLKLLSSSFSKYFKYFLPVLLR